MRQTVHNLSESVAFSCTPDSVSCESFQVSIIYLLSVEQRDGNGGSYVWVSGDYGNIRANVFSKMAVVWKLLQ